MAGGGSWGSGSGTTPSTDTEQVVETAVNYTTVVGDDMVIGSGTITITLLPLANAIKSMTIKADDSTAEITIDPDGTETIDGSSTYFLSAGRSVTITPISSGWVIV